MATKKDLKKKTAKAAPAKSAGKAAVKSKVAKPAAKAAASKSAAVKKSAPAKPAAKGAAKPAAKAAVKTDPKASKKAADPKLDPKALKAAAAAAGLVKKPDVIMKNGKPVPVKGLKPGEAEPPGDADSPLLDMSDVGVRKMIAKAKTRGYVTYDELNKVLPSEKVSSEQIEDTMAMLNEMGINVIESEEQEEGEGGEAGLPATTIGTAVATTATGKETYDRTDDPVRMYLREMGSVE
ncbi:MAG TPA: RNA polymerase sigma factor region1.1 domain-containing protein, partial [Rhizomicrobium sp.]